MATALRGRGAPHTGTAAQAVLQDPYGAFNPFYRVRHVFDVAARNFDVASAGAERQRAIEGALAYVGLDPDRFLDRFPHELSGGERQRLMIARAFLLRPKPIVADEPVSMIDASLRASILDIIIRLNKDEGISFLYITHDLSTLTTSPTNWLCCSKARPLSAARRVRSSIRRSTSTQRCWSIRCQCQIPTCVWTRPTESRGAKPSVA